MSSIASVPTPAAALAPTGPGLGFGRLVRLEVRKQVDTRAGRGLLVAIALLSLLVTGIVMWVSREQGATMDSLLAAATTPLGMLLPVLGIVKPCNEWSQRTALVTFTQEPRRLRVMAAKLVAAVALATALLVVAVLLAVLAHVVSMAIAGGSMALGLSWGQLGRLWLGQALGVLQGVGFGMALLSVPFAVVAYYVAPPVVMALCALVPWLRRLAPWIDSAQAYAPLTSGAPLSGHEWARMAVASLIWVGLPLAFGLWRVARKEVK